MKMMKTDCSRKKSEKRRSQKSFPAGQVYLWKLVESERENC